MSLRAALKTPRDLLEKLKRDVKLLQNQVTSDRFFNFVVTAYSLIDWIQNDSNSPKSAKSALSAHRKNELLEVCRDVANANKHFELDTPNKKKSITSGVDSESGFGSGRYGCGPYGQGEESIKFKLHDGKNIDVLQFSRDVENIWSRFFDKHYV